MKPRQRSGGSGKLSAQQRSLLELSVERLSGVSTSNPPEPVSGLAGMYYHPQRACRTFSLVLSAAFDAAHQRTDSTQAKLQRALDVEKLLDPGGSGEALLEDLSERFERDADSFFELLDNTVIPHFVSSMNASDTTHAPSREAAAQPRTLDDGEVLPMERLSPRSSSPIEANRFDREQFELADAEPLSSIEEDKGELPVEAANVQDENLENEVLENTNDELELAETVEDGDAATVEDVDAATIEDGDVEIVEDGDDQSVMDVVDGEGESSIEEEDMSDDSVPSDEGAEVLVDGAPADSDLASADEPADPESSDGRQPYGVSSAEEEEAMVAALAVMESDETEEIVERGRRFDPDVDLEEDDGSQRRRRRRPKSAEGLEWRSVDSKDDLPRAEEVARAAAAAAGAAGVENLAEVLATRYEIVDAACVAEGIMGAGQMLLRTLDLDDLTGRVRVEIRITQELGDEKPRPRRRRRRSRSRSRD